MNGCYSQFCKNYYLYISLIQNLPTGLLLKCKEAKKSENKKRNRYKNVYPCKYSCSL